jgi:hypothetical protein
LKKVPITNATDTMADIISTGIIYNTDAIIDTITIPILQDEWFQLIAL